MEPSQLLSLGEIDHAYDELHAKNILLIDACESVLACELERQTAQLSGLETGWEHPCTHTAFNQALSKAKAALK